MIIVCDDNKVYSEFLESIVTSMTDLKVKLTNSCAELINELQVLDESGRMPSLIFMDLVMFPVTGIECIKHLSEAYDKPVPIVAMSGAITKDTLAEVRGYGVMPFISKTHDEKKVMKDIEALLHIFAPDNRITFTRRTNDRRTDAGDS